MNVCMCGYILVHMPFIQCTYLIHVIAGDVHVYAYGQQLQEKTCYYVQPAVLFTSLSPCVYWT